MKQLANCLKWAGWVVFVAVCIIGLEDMICYKHIDRSELFEGHCYLVRYSDLYNKVDDTLVTYKLLYIDRDMYIFELYNNGKAIIPLWRIVRESSCENKFSKE